MRPHQSVQPMKLLHLVNIWKIKLKHASFSCQFKLIFLISSAYQVQAILYKKYIEMKMAKKQSLTIFLHTFRATLF